MIPTTLFQSSQITEAVTRAAVDAGFDLAGIAPVGDSPELEYFPQWIEEGRAGEMKYLEARDEQGRLKRASLANVAPWARSVVVCAINYNTAQPYSTQFADKGQGWISRYSWSAQDYHDSLMKRLRQVESAIRNAALGASVNRSMSTPPSGFENNELMTRCYVDTGPIVERVAAKYAGIGWIGKNTCIINQKVGSWMFLGVILTSLELTASLPAPDRCGSCTRCIDACPTDAFIAPYRLDSNKCIAYLTIEKRGAIPEEMRAGIGRHVFGCDICQDVCPWNRKAPATKLEEFQPRAEMVNPALDWLAEISAEEFRSTFRGTPVSRAKRAGLRRNAVVAMGNSGKKKFLPLLKKLATDEDAIVAESAVRAILEIG
ncbi:MAG TPA: tRNA epoxyqueuosine(34) reductase QueG [Candidatus Aquilonibacter sp.]|jgi:epoxyqueuosine reductase|nr:tRNA epoxyqueuosine(34) reductase QueG [Candidatus Aquilonibacter sp.]